MNLKASDRDVTQMADLVMDLCGIYLDQTKGYLIEARLADVAKKYDCQSYSELANKARGNGERALRREIVDHITTNETQFFRDTAPFIALQNKLIPDLFDKRKSSAHPHRIRIWSAACSTGQEVYSIAITLSELIPDIHNWDVHILGTDISSMAIEAASLGVYSELSISRGVSDAYRSKYFHRVGNHWQVNDSLRALVQFEQTNLNEPFHNRPIFDIIFCRNVAIYFTTSQRNDLFRRLHSCLAGDGTLLIGNGESLTHMPELYNLEFHCGTATYRKRQPKLPKTAEPIANDLHRGL